MVPGKTKRRFRDSLVLAVSGFFSLRFQSKAFPQQKSSDGRVSVALTAHQNGVQRHFLGGGVKGGGGGVRSFEN